VLALQLHQEHIQVVRSNKVVHRIPTKLNGTPALYLGFEDIRIRRYTNKRGIELNTHPIVIRLCVCVCLCCFVLLNRYWGIVTVPGSFIFRGPGVAGSSPFTLTTSLVTPVVSFSSSNGPTTTTLTTRGLCPGGSVVWAGPKFVRPYW